MQENEQNLANYAVWLEEKKRRANQLAVRAEIDYANITAHRNCKIHENEPIKYFCRDDKVGLCAECIVHHAKHDFIFADEDAAKEVKGNLDFLFKSVDDHHQKYSELHRNLESSREDLEKFREMDFLENISRGVGWRRRLIGSRSGGRKEIVWKKSGGGEFGLSGEL